MSWQDFNNGRLGIGGNKGSSDWQDGAAVRERERARQQPASAPPVTPAWTPPRHSVCEPGMPAPRIADHSVATLRSTAKSAASVAAALFVGYVLLRGGWGWGQLAAGAIGMAVIGAAAGAAFYIALKILEIALKIAGALLSVGFFCAVVYYLFR